MSPDLPTVALIIVAYGHAEHLAATLSALQALDYPQERRTIIVVENGDGSSAAVARTVGGAEVLEPGRNLGFAGGCNVAVAHAESEIVALINPDLRPTPQFLRELVAPLTNAQVGVVGAKLRYPDGETIQHAGGYLTEPILLAQHDGYGEPDHGYWDSPRDVPFVTGAALALRRALWNEIDGLDESFFPAYYEDVDLCWRVRQRGLLVRYEPRAVATHVEAAGLGKTTLDYHRLYHRNRLRLLWKHYADDWLIRTWLPAELAHLRTTADDAEIDALLEAYLHWQATFVSGTEQITDDAARMVDSRPLTDHRPRTQSELAWTLEQVEAKRTLRPLPFRSRWPLVAGLRDIWNRIATETYVRPLIQQQNDYNAALAELGQALARQRRATDAAIACQGMALAKLLRRTTP